MTCQGNAHVLTTKMGRSYLECDDPPAAIARPCDCGAITVQHEYVWPDEVLA
jgi:hypothetical protein